MKEYIDCEGKIEKLVNELTLVAVGYEVIDCSGKYAVLGLINAHAYLFSSGKPSNFHASQKLLKVRYRLMRTALGKALLFKIMENNAEIALSSGGTSIRTVGEFFYQDIKLRDYYSMQNEKIGPNLMVSGFFLSITDGHGAPDLSLESDSPWEVERVFGKM